MYDRVSECQKRKVSDSLNPDVEPIAKKASKDLSNDVESGRNINDSLITNFNFVNYFKFFKSLSEFNNSDIDNELNETASKYYDKPVIWQNRVFNFNNCTFTVGQN